MARKKSSTEIKFHPGFWCNSVVDDFVNADEGNGLPETWGGNVTQRYASAMFVAWVSVKPSELEIPQGTGAPNMHPRPETERRDTFSRLFALAPDYFISLVQYVRERRTEVTQIVSVATALHFEGDDLLYSANGSVRTDKEVAAILERRPDAKLAGLHPSVIGKARRYLAASQQKMIEAQIERFIRAGSETIDVLSRLASQQGVRLQADPAEDKLPNSV